MSRFKGEEQLIAQNGEFQTPGSQQITDRVHFLAPLRSSARFISRATICMARSLKASVGP